MIKRTLLTGAAVFALSTPAFAITSLTANFEPGKPLEIMNQDEDPNSKADISVVDGKAGYQGIGGNPDVNQSSFGTDPRPVSGLFGDGTVIDYRFFRSPASEPVDNTIPVELVTYASGSAGRIGTVFATNKDLLAGSQSFIQVWETSDPGVGFGGGAQIVPATSANFTTNTMAGLGDGSGTIDISDMLTGQIYFLAGGFGGTERFTLTMSGAGQTNIVVVGDAFWPRDNRVHLHDWSFQNTDLLYDTISYTFFQSDRDGSAARFGGVILDGEIAAATFIPEPATATLGLLGLGGLMLRRRRMA